MHRLFSLAICVVAAADLFTFNASANADTTVRFTGRVDDVPAELMSQFQPGMSMEGFYRFDESLALAEFVGTVTEFQMEIGDYSVQQSPVILGDITVSPSEYVAVAFADGPPVGDGLNPLLMAIQLSRSTPPIDTTSPLPPPVETLDVPLWTMDFSSLDGSFRLSGAVESIVVPEPSAGLISLVGLVIGGSVVRRGSRRKRALSRSSPAADAMGTHDLGGR